MAQLPAGGPAGTVVQSPQAESTGTTRLGAAALALLLYALLADAAVETFASGSPVRWWVAGIVLLYASVTVALWQGTPRLWSRLGWRGRTAASLFLLLGLLAFTAWQPGGQAAGVRLAAQPTARVLAAVSALAVLVSALILLRALRPAPLWLRAVIGALAVYGLAGLVLGIVRHTPYPDLLRGASLWARAPFWLQGAFLGAFVVVPVAVAAELIALVRGVSAGGSRSATLGRAAALVLSALVAVPALTLQRSAGGVARAGSTVELAFADAAQVKQAAAERLVDEPPDASPEADPARLIDAAGAAVRGFRSEEWEVGALAASLGTDPAAAFAFVRDAIAFDPYAGVLRGAEGTLAARAGNAWDRALLLRALLAKSGLATRLAFATVDGETVGRLIARAHQRPARPLSAAAPAGLVAKIVTSVASRARRDDAALRLALGSRLDGLGVDEAERLRQAAASHAWVQVQKGDAWIDLDPTLADAQMGKALAAASGTAVDVPPGQQHAVVVRVIAETLADGKLSESVPLERVLPAQTAANQYLLLALLPGDGNGGGLLARRSTSPTSFVPTLWVGDEAQAGRAIATSAAGGGVGFDSLFGGGEGAGSELAGLFIEVETRVPGRPPTVARHLLLDRVPPDARSAPRVRTNALRPLAPGGGMPRALQGLHHVMVSTGGLSPVDVARLRLATLEAVLGSGSSTPSQPPPPDTPAWPLWASDRSLVEGSEQLVVPALDSMGRGRAYVDEPRVFLASWFPEPTGVERISRETDLLIDSVRVLTIERGSARETVEGQLRYGALQSALETETALQMAAAWDPADRKIVSTSLAMGTQLTVLGPGDVQRLPPTAAGSLRKALRDGHLVVVPGEMSAAAAWWTVARSGLARAIVETGAAMSGIVGKVGPVNPGSGHNMGGNPGGKGRGGQPGKGDSKAGTEYRLATEASKQARQYLTDSFSDAPRQSLAKVATKLGQQ